MILLTHHTGEPHGILGPQTAATYITRRLGIPTIIVGLMRGFDRPGLFRYLDEYYRGKEKVVLFSHLCGRQDIIELIGHLKEAGFRTILGGPQAAIDYYGEDDASSFPVRFQGLRSIIDTAFQGPVDGLTVEMLTTGKQCFRREWKKDVYLDTDWSNIHVFSDRLEKLPLRLAQVLGAIGCPHAQRRATVNLPPPNPLKQQASSLDIPANGCVFCDVAKDKGFCGPVSAETLLRQIVALPEEEDGAKIPFELIDEYPLVSLRRTLELADRMDIRFSQVNLVCRVDDITHHADTLADILGIAAKRGTKIMFSSIGFESFSETILKYFNKGITVDDNIKCVQILRQMKDRFGDTLLYRTDEGAFHGFIYPTPWDDSSTKFENDSNVMLYQLYEDILPTNSTPLIIHHSSYLADWLRLIEVQANVRFTRSGTWIEWWSIAGTSDTPV
jgi:hypothetical protein